MHRLSYVSSTSESVDLDGGGAWVGTAAGLRGNGWSYSLGHRSLSGVGRAARECEADAWFTDPAAADRLRALGDMDMAYGRPGKLVSGEWFQRAYLAKSEIGGVLRGRHSATLTFVLLDGRWRRERRLLLRPAADPASGPLDLPCDGWLDLGASTRLGLSVVNESLVPSDVRIVFHGPDPAPSLAVGGNSYMVREAAPAGGSIVVDGSASPRSITLYDRLGNSRDAFASGVRGAGAGSGAYCFEPLPPGESPVTWDGSASIDLSWFEESGELPWSS